MVNVRDADDGLNRTRLIGSLNTLKAIWPLLSEPECAVTQENIKIVICSVLCCLYSGFSEVVVPCIELLERIMTNPLPWLRDFVPLMFDATSSSPPFRCKSLSSGRPSRSASPVSGINTLPPSSLGSLCDVTVTADEINDFNVPLQLPDHSIEPAISESSSPLVEEEIIDPLMHADLYEEVTKCDRYGSDQTSPQMVGCSDDSVGVVKHLPLDVCDFSANCFVYTAAILGKRFLLAGLKGLKNDRDVRISHKILALNCITMISKHEDLSRATLLFGDFQQTFSEVSRFVLHDDDQLCASTVAFLFSIDRHKFENTDNVHNYHRVMRTFQPIRKRSVLQASIGQQHILDALGLLPDALCLATSEVSSTFFLLKVTCGEFLSSLRWSLINECIREKWQEQCLIAYFNLLFSDDQKVAHAASTGLEQLVRNADFTEYSGVFAARIPDNLLSLDMNSLPAVSLS
uniref:MOR2-PAG1_C domain-containing protein n=1 Tax=Angiostrongylus cantonensis TaxID=6313 RepID=A0A0K0D755_ANGCA